MECCWPFDVVVSSLAPTCCLAAVKDPRARWRFEDRTRSERRTGDRKKSDPISSAVRFDALTTSVITTLPRASPCATAAAADAPPEARTLTRRALPRRGVVRSATGVRRAGDAAGVRRAGDAGTRGAVAAVEGAGASSTSTGDGHALSASMSTSTPSASMSTALVSTSAVEPAAAARAELPPACGEVAETAVVGIGDAADPLANRSSLSANMSTSTPSPRHRRPASGEASGDAADVSGLAAARTGVATRRAGPRDRGVLDWDATAAGAGEAGAGSAGTALGTGAVAGGGGGAAACFGLVVRRPVLGATVEAGAPVLLSHSAFRRDTVPVGMPGDLVGTHDLATGSAAGAEAEATVVSTGVVAAADAAVAGVLALEALTTGAASLVVDGPGTLTACGAAAAVAVPRTSDDMVVRMALKLRRFANSGVGRDGTPLGVALSAAVDPAPAVAADGLCSTTT